MEKKEYSREEIAKIAPNYRGKPENFSLEKAKKRTTMRGQKKEQPQANSILAESIFGVDVHVFPIHPRQNFSINLSKAPQIATEVYNACQPYEKQLDRLLDSSEMTYYVTALTWLRLIDIKCKQGRTTLSSAEKDLRKATMEDQFNVPQPIYAYLSQIGDVSDKGGKTTELDVPDLPTTRVQGYGGYHAAAVNEHTHNLFEELPSLGIAGDVLMALRPNGSEAAIPNYRIGKPDRTAFTENLCCAVLQPGLVRPEIITRLRGQGITQNEFAEYVPDTRFNLGYIRQPSDIIGRFETFRIEKVNIPAMDSTGGEVQIVKTIPETVQTARTN